MSGNEQRAISAGTECIYGIVTVLLFAAAARTIFFSAAEQTATQAVVDAAPLLAIGWTMLLLAPNLLPSFRKK